MNSDNLKNVKKTIYDNLDELNSFFDDIDSENLNKLINFSFNNDVYLSVIILDFTFLNKYISFKGSKNPKKNAVEHIIAIVKYISL